MIKTKEFCDIHKIPYTTFNLHINEKGEKVSRGIACSKLKGDKWTSWDYDRCMKFNKLESKYPENALNINLTNSKFMIIDIDEKELKTEYLEKYGDSNQSTSTRKKLPHLWRLKHEDDKNTTKTGFKKGLDLIYTNVFEWIDSTIENYTEVLPIFNDYPAIIEKKKRNNYIKDGKHKSIKNLKEYKLILNKINGIYDMNKIPYYEKYTSDHKDFLDKHKLMINKYGKIVNKENKQIIETNSIDSIDSGIEVDNKLKEYLDLIPSNVEYDIWTKIVFSLRNDNINNYKLAKEWSESKKDSKRVSCGAFDRIWEDNKNTEITLGTLYFYANKYDPYKYRLLQLNKSLSDSDDNLSCIFINLQNENLIYTNEELFIYKKNWIKDDKKNQQLKKLIRITLRNFSIHLDTENNKEMLSCLDEDRLSLLQSKKKSINSILDSASSNNKLNNICSLVLQDLAYLDKNVKFDLCEKQLYNLHFKNGVYELDNKIFRKRTQSDYITKFLDWEYNAKVDEDIFNEIDNFYSKLQPDEQQKKFSLEWMAYCLSGSCGKQRFKMNIGYSAGNGKSTEFKIHDKVFDIYSFKLDNKTFNEKNDKKHKQLIHLIKNPIRFSYCEELKQDKLDIDFIKDFVDGSKINCEIMYGTSESHSIQAKLTTCSNKDFNADIDGGILRRGLVQFYDSKFRLDVEDNYETNIYKRIDEYESRFNNEDYKNAYLHLLLSHYNKDFKVPESNENAFKDIGNEYDDMQNILDSHFTITNNDNDMVNKKDMELIFKSSLKLSWRELLSKLKSKGLKYNKEKHYKKCKGVFIGIKLNEEHFIDDE